MKSLVIIRRSRLCSGSSYSGKDDGHIVARRRFHTVGIVSALNRGSTNAALIRRRSGSPPMSGCHATAPAVDLSASRHSANSAGRLQRALPLSASRESPATGQIRGFRCHVLTLRAPATPPPTHVWRSAASSRGMPRTAVQLQTGAAADLGNRDPQSSSPRTGPAPTALVHRVGTSVMLATDSSPCRYAAAICASCRR